MRPNYNRLALDVARDNSHCVPYRHYLGIDYRPR